MGARAFKPCSASGCQTLTDDRSGRCPAHPLKPWARAATPNAVATERIRGRKGQAMRAACLARHPLCQLCERKGIVSVATVRDHVIPLAEGGRDDEQNEQALCDPCHDEKTAAERLRGVLRWNDKADDQAPAAEPKAPPRRYVIG